MRAKSVSLLEFLRIKAKMPSGTTVAFVVGVFDVSDTEWQDRLAEVKKSVDVVVVGIYSDELTLKTINMEGFIYPFRDREEFVSRHSRRSPVNYILRIEKDRDMFNMAYEMKPDFLVILKMENNEILMSQITESLGRVAGKIEFA